MPSRRNSEYACIPLTVTGRYGKTKVRVSRVRRLPARTEGGGPWHDLCEVEVETLLEGDLEETYSKGDNRKVLPTDTVKNTTYAIAQRSNFTSIEDLGVALIDHYLERHGHLDRITVNMTETLWRRHEVSGEPHEHTFVELGPEKRTAQCVGDRSGKRSVTAGLKDLKVMKTTQSGFEDYIVDSYTTLHPARDRMLCTSVSAKWTYGRQNLPLGRFAIWNEAIRGCMLDVFSGPAKIGVYSPSVQETMYKMGRQALKICPLLETINLSLPNIHYFQFDMKKLGLADKNEVFFPTSEPSGIIECTVSRSDVRARL